MHGVYVYDLTPLQKIGLNISSVNAKIGPSLYGDVIYVIDNAIKQIYFMNLFRT